jgi:hypothetical protein
MGRKVNFLPQGLLRGFEPYGYEDSPLYELAKANSKSPLDSWIEILAKVRHFMRFIACHHGAGDGWVISDERKISWVPSYKDRVITEGSIFHIVTLWY